MEGMDHNAGEVVVYNEKRWGAKTFIFLKTHLIIFGLILTIPIQPIRYLRYIRMGYFCGP